MVGLFALTSSFCIHSAPSWGYNCLISEKIWLVFGLTDALQLGLYSWGDILNMTPTPSH